MIGPPTCVSQIAFSFDTLPVLICVSGEYRWFIVEPPFVDHPDDGDASCAAVNAGAGTISALEDDVALCATPAATATRAVASTAATIVRRLRELVARFSLIRSFPSRRRFSGDAALLHTFRNQDRNAPSGW